MQHTAAQEPWLQAQSIRDNIVGGAEWDEDRYQRTLSDCSLLDDLDSMPYGDKTLVGERGLSMSGSVSSNAIVAEVLQWPEVASWARESRLRTIRHRLARCALLVPRAS